MRSREWMDATTASFLGGVHALSDEDFDAATGLPGWTRRHLIGHVHANALALGRLTSWAATGVECRMYPSREHRDAEIAELAARPAGELRSLVHASADDLAAALDALPADAWTHEVVTAQGRTVPAS
jgi:maleylpyruvate isomerase